MKIGIAGAGNIGSALAIVLRKLGHTVQIANSRGPETLTDVAQTTGATPVPISDVAKGVDLLVITIPMKSVPLLPKGLLSELPQESPVVDTGNYILLRDGVIDKIEAGETESEWTSGVLGRPVIKAFNNIITDSIIHGGLPKGSEKRIALPVAGDDSKAKQLVIALIDAMGFDSVDAGSLSQSWRQQPGTPAYATNYDSETLEKELANADRKLAPEMSERTMQMWMSLPPGTPPEEIVRLARSLWN